ncbi:MAG: PAS domain-containing protein [Gammaproteobacteria bacterium]|nr:PAS domain-containing protein [Gammaproteobacteria bacterium]
MTLLQYGKVAKDILIIAAVIAGGTYGGIRFQSFVNQAKQERATIQLENMISTYTLRMQDAFAMNVKEVNGLANYVSHYADTAEPDRFKSYLQDILQFDAHLKQVAYLQQSEAGYIDMGDAYYYTQDTTQKRLVKDAELQTKLSQDVSSAVALLTTESRKKSTYYLAAPMKVTSENAEMYGANHNYFVAEFGFSATVDEVLQSVVPDWMDVVLYDSPSPRHYQQLHYFSAKNNKKIIDPISQDNPHAVFLPGSIDIQGHMISVLYSPNSSDFFEAGTAESFMSFFLIAGSSYALAIYLITLKRREIKINHLVEERTQELSESQKKIQMLINSVDGLLWEAHPHSNIFTYVSGQAEKMFGYPRERWLEDKKFFKSLIHPDDYVTVITKNAEETQALRNYDYACRMLTAAGKEIWVRNRVTVVTKDKTPLILRGVMFDITEGKIFAEEKEKMAKELQQSQKLESIGQLAAGIAHEINTPAQFVGDNIEFLKSSFDNYDKLIMASIELTKIIQSKDLFIDEVASVNNIIKEIDLGYLQEELPVALAQSKEGVQRISKIVSAMKAFSHPGSGEKELSDINKSIENTITVSRSEWRDVAEIVTHLDENLPMVSCYIGEINQTVLNIIVNAAHAIGDTLSGKDISGEITISTQKIGADIEIRIADNGPGMPEAIMKKIFDPFFTTKVVGKGTGQGLSMARNCIVNRHGGDLNVKSEIGKGTEFIIRLPITAEVKKV